MHTYDRNYFKIALPAALEGLFMILGGTAERPRVLS